MKKRALHFSFLLFFLPLLMAVVLSRFAIFVRHDALAAHYPAKKILVAQLKEGSVPYWNPAASFGQPLLADPNMEGFYPDTLLYLVLPFDAAWNFHFLFHWILGMSGMYALLRLLGKQKRTSIIGAIWWGGSGFILSASAYYNMVVVVNWIPCVILLETLLLEKPRMLYALSLGTAIGLQFLGGEPVACLSTWLLCLFFAALWRKKIRARTLLFAGSAVIIAAVTVIPQCLALMEIYGFTSRAMVQHSFYSASNASLEIQRLMEWLVPYCWGPPFDQAPALFAGHRFTNNPFLYDSVHLSFFLLMSFFFAFQKKRIALYAAFVLFFLLSLGRFTPLWKFLFDTIPHWSTIHFPSKFVAAWLLVMIIIGAEGFEDWFDQKGRKITTAWLIFAGIWSALVLAYFLWLRPLHPFYVQRILIAAALLLLSLAVALRYKPAIILLIVGEAVSGGWYLTHCVSRNNLEYPKISAASARTYFDPNLFPIFHRYSGRGELYRAQTSTAFPLWGGPYGFQYAFDPTVDGLYSFYNDYFGSFLSTLPKIQRLQTFSHLGVRQIITNDSINAPGWVRNQNESYFDYTNAAPAPLFFPVAKVEAPANPKRTLTGILNDPGLTFARWKTSQASYEIPERFGYQKWSASSYRIELQNSKKAFVVGRMTYFPVWRAVARFQDGETRILSVNQIDLTFVGFEVPEGAKEITVFYSSRITMPLFIGFFVLLIALTGCLACSIFVNEWGDLSQI